jgi:hypothetical protein
MDDPEFKTQNTFVATFALGMAKNIRENGWPESMGGPRTYEEQPGFGPLGKKWMSLWSVSVSDSVSAAPLAVCSETLSPLILSSSRPLSFFLLSSLEPVEGGWPPTFDENFANQKAGSDAALKSLESEPYINHMLQFVVAEGNYPMASVQLLSRLYM